MSTLLRLPFALLTALAMLLLWSGVASAEGETATTPALDQLCTAEGGLKLCEEPPADTSTTQDEPMGPSEGVRAFNGLPQTSPEQQPLSTPAEQTPAEQTAGQQTELPEGQQADEQSGAQAPAPSGDSAPDPAAVGECIATQIEDLVALLQESLGGAAEELTGKIQAGLTDPTKLPEFLAGLPTLIESTVPELADELGTELPAAIEGIVACLPAPPASEQPEPTPPAPKPAAQPTQHEVHYANCDDARAKGAAPVHAGQPGYGAHLDSDNDGVGCEQEVMAVSHTPKPQAQLAYTGFDVGPFAGAGAAMLAAGSLLVAGARRRS